MAAKIYTIRETNTYFGHGPGSGFTSVYEKTGTFEELAKYFQMTNEFEMLWHGFSRSRKVPKTIRGLLSALNACEHNNSRVVYELI